ncbi:MAG: hypothetical protein ACHQRO_08750, partial [Vicinamibacteria bacterium]
MESDRRDDEREAAEHEAHRRAQCPRLELVGDAGGHGLDFDEAHVGRGAEQGGAQQRHDGGPFLYAGTAGFFETLGVPILRGRAFAAADDVDGAEPVGMVSATFARTAWPNRDPVGQCFRMGA